MNTLVLEAEPLAQDVHFDEHSLRIILQDGREIAAPLAWYPRLRDATPMERRHCRLIGLGEGIHWSDIDEEISVLGLLSGR